MTLVMTRDDFSDDPLTTVKICWQHLTTPSGDTYRQSQKLPVLQGSTAFPNTQAALYILRQHRMLFRGAQILHLLI